MNPVAPVRRLEPLRDLGMALRALRARPAFTLFVVATLAVGIGTAVAAFVFLSYFLRPTIEAPEPERVAWLRVVTEEGAFPGTTADDFRALEAGGNALGNTPGNTLFDRIAGWRLFSASLAGPSDRRLAWGHAVSGGYFELFGARARLGRLIGPEDDRAGAEPVLVLSELTWRRQFGADPSVVGRSVLLNGVHARTVIGVAPAGFQGEGIWTGVYVPLASAGSLLLPDREVSALVRIAPGVGLAAANERLAAVARGFDAERPLPAGPRRFRFTSTTEFDPAWSGDAMFAASKSLMAAVGMLLAASCASVASLLLARGASRRRELAVHAALGAGTGRLARRLAYESLLLVGAGALAGSALARELVALVERYLRHEIPVSMGDWAAGTRLTVRADEVALFVIALTLGCALLAGVAPVLQVARLDLVRLLGRESARRRSSWRPRRFLLALQIALSCVLLVGATLLARSLGAARSVPLGFDAEGLQMATLFVPRERSAAAGGERLHAEIVQRVRALPGVEAAGLVSTVPLSVILTTSKIEAHGQRGELATNVAGDGLFAALGVSIESGRDFDLSDTPETPKVAILNRTAALRFLPGREAVGETIVLHPDGFEKPGEPYRVVGVVADSRFETGTDEIGPLAYLSYAQAPRPRCTILVRAGHSLTAPIQALLRESYPELAVVAVAPFGAQLERAVALRTMHAELAAAVALVGLLFAIVGIFGVSAQAVAESSREVALRIAVGAGRGDVVRWALGNALGPLAWGLALGLPAAFGAGSLLRSQLVGVAGHDPVTFASVALLLGAAAVGAGWLPARRATRVAPAVLLRDA